MAHDCLDFKFVSNASGCGWWKVFMFFSRMKSTFIKGTFIKKQKKWPKHVEDLCPTIFFVGYLPFSGQFRNKYAGLDFWVVAATKLASWPPAHPSRPRCRFLHHQYSCPHLIHKCRWWAQHICWWDCFFNIHPRQYWLPQPHPKPFLIKKLLTPYVKYCVSLEHVHGSQKILFGQFRRIRRVIPRCNTSVEMAVWP